MNLYFMYECSTLYTNTNKHLFYANKTFSESGTFMLKGYVLFNCYAY